MYSGLIWCRVDLVSTRISSIEAADVAAAVRVARNFSTPLSYRSGGHSYTCNGIKRDFFHRTRDKEAFFDRITPDGWNTKLSRVLALYRAEA